MSTCTAKVYIEGVPIEALRHVQRAMMVAGYEELAKVYSQEIICLKPMKCNLCEHDECSTFCADCKRVNIMETRDWFEPKGGDDED